MKSGVAPLAELAYNFAAWKTHQWFMRIFYGVIGHQGYKTIFYKGIGLALAVLYMEKLLQTCLLKNFKTIVYDL
jgi:hypothetical protein